APERRRQLISRVFFFRVYSEVREEGLSLPRRKRQAALTEPGLKPPEEPKGETRHSAFPEGGDAASEYSTFRRSEPPKATNPRRTLSPALNLRTQFIRTISGNQEDFRVFFTIL